jgi:DNA-binding transcriptional LysR family regulator
MPDALPACIPEALRRFAEVAPGIEVVLDAAPPHTLADEVRHGGLDAAVMCLPFPVAGLRVAPLGDEWAVCVVPEGHGFSAEMSLAPDEIEDTPLVMMPRASNPAFHDAVIGTWGSTGLAAPRLDARAQSVDHVLLSVAAGAGIGLLPASAAERRSAHGLDFIPLEPFEGCEIAVVSRAEHSTTVAAFVRLAGRLAGPVATRELELV